MAGICYCGSSYQILAPMRIHGIQCCSDVPNSKKRGTQAPKFLRTAVNGVTEFLRLFSSPDKGSLSQEEQYDRIVVFEVLQLGNFRRLDTVNDKSKDENLVSNVDDVLMIIKSDYEKAYFVTGIFTSEIYADDCTFEDPTIKFQGKDLYYNNLKLLVPFFDNPSIKLKNIEKGIDSTTDQVVASWKLRTYLKLPWRPLISVDGTTVYDLDEQLRVVRHVESWSISAIEAIAQIFTPSFGTYDD